VNFIPNDISIALLGDTVLARPVVADSELRSLTGLRGLAACWVMVGHYVRGPSLNENLAVVFFHSYIAVDLFMILSGFVLAMTYGARLFRPGRGQIQTYVLSRLARIFPLYALTTLVCWLLVQAGIEVWGGPTASMGALASNLLLVEIWGWPNDSLNAAGWSISTEWAANLLFPLFVLALLRSPLRRATLIAGASLLCLLAAALFYGQTGDNQPLAGAINWYSAPFALTRCTTEFMLGMFCWRLRSQARWTMALGLTPVLVIILLMIAPLMLTSSFDVVLVLLASLLVIGLSFERSIVSDLFGTPVVRWLGTISFSIYLWQMPLLVLRPWLSRVFGSAELSYPELLPTLITMGIVIGVSALSLMFVEKPAQQWIKRGFRRWKLVPA